MGEGDGGYRALGPEGGHVLDEISLVGGGSCLHGIEPGRAGDNGTSDSMLVWLVSNSAGG